MLGSCYLRSFYESVKKSNPPSFVHKIRYALKKVVGTVNAKTAIHCEIPHAQLLVIKKERLVVGVTHGLVTNRKKLSL